MGGSNVIRFPTERARPSRAALVYEVCRTLCRPWASMDDMPDIYPSECFTARLTFIMRVGG